MSRKKREQKKNNMSLNIYTVEENKKWDAIVKSFYNYDVYWLSGYVKAFQIHGDGKPLLFYYEDLNTRGINVVMKRDIAKEAHFVGRLPENQYYDFASPYGYGGWLIEGEQCKKLFLKYNDWCMNNKIISEFVRFHPVLENQVYSEENYEVIALGNTVTLDISSPEIVWENITSKNRNMIRKAQKNGIEIYNGRYPELFETFRKIYNKTMDKDNAKDYYYFEQEFYNSILKDLPQHAQIFFAEYENRVIASSIILAANGRLNYHLSGSVKEFSNLAPTNLILYKVALWGASNGYKTFYLGGGVGSDEDSLYKFKKAFYRKDNVKRFYIGKKVFLQEEYNKLIGMRGIIENKFFPQYRT